MPVRSARMMPVALLGLAPAVALGVPVEYEADLTTLNDSGVTGTANLTLDEAVNELSVNITATGLEPGQPHAQHIHGLVDDAGAAVDSTSPTLDQDTDGDGFVELAEGAVTYGPILVPLTSPPGGALEGFPTAPDGTIDFSQVYDLNDSATFADGFSVENLLALDRREIVLHGLTVGVEDGAGTDGEVDGTAGYKAVLPVASGEIRRVEAVPEPATLGLLLTGGLMTFGAARGRRRC